MLRLRLIGRSLKLYFSLTLPLSVIAACLFGWPAAVIVAALMWFFLLAIAAFAEGPIIRAHGPCLPAASGMDRSLELAAGDFLGRLPRILIYESPLPNALVVRGLFGRGTVLLSQGLLSLLKEDELRQALADSLGELKRPGMIFRSLCSALAAWCLRLAPRQWVAFLSGEITNPHAAREILTPQSGLGFLLVFPLLRLFLELGRPFQPKTSVSQETGAAHKILQGLRFGGAAEFPGARHLYLFEAKSGQRLLPF